MGSQHDLVEQVQSQERQNQWEIDRHALQTEAPTPHVHGVRSTRQLKSQSETSITRTSSSRSTPYYYMKRRTLVSPRVTDKHTPMVLYGVIIRTGYYVRSIQQMSAQFGAHSLFIVYYVCPGHSGQHTRSGKPLNSSFGIYGIHQRQHYYGVRATEYSVRNSP